MNKSSNVRSSCYTIVNDKLDIEVNITNRTFNFLDKTTFIYSTSLCLSRQQTWILPCLPSHWVTHIKYIYVIYTNTYKKKKRGRRADPFRNNSKRKTSRIDNWHHETEKRNREWGMLDKRGDARSRTLDGIDERQWWVRERSSRENKNKDEVSFVFLSPSTSHIQHITTSIDYAKRQFHLEFTYFLIIV